MALIFMNQDLKFHSVKTLQKLGKKIEEIETENLNMTIEAPCEKLLTDPV